MNSYLFEKSEASVESNSVFNVTETLAEQGILLRARRNEKDLKVKPATSFKYFQYLLTKIKAKFKAEKI